MYGCISPTFSASLCGSDLDHSCTRKASRHWPIALDRLVALRKYKNASLNGWIKCTYVAGSLHWAWQFNIKLAKKLILLQRDGCSFSTNLSRLITCKFFHTHKIYKSYVHKRCSLLPSQPETTTTMQEPLSTLAVGAKRFHVENNQY